MTNVTVEEVNRNVNGLRSEVATEHGKLKSDIEKLDRRVDQHDISRAELRGAIRMLTWLVGIGLAGPAAVVSWMVLNGWVSV